MKLNTTIVTVLPSTVLAAIIIAIYWPGASGALFYDDYNNLGGLASVSNLTSVFHFATSGHAGPLGRPLSLLTFAMQADAWPDSSESLLKFNIILHAANAFVLYWLLLLILELTAHVRFEFHERIAIAALATALWSLMPLLASTSLILVQRMTGLSAFFILASIVAYLLCFRIVPKYPTHALLLQFLTVGCGTLLAVLSKENGALLPVYLLVLEATLLNASPEAKPFRRWRLLALSLPLLALFVYLSPLFRSWFEVNDFRGFSSWQRLQTQSVLLWKYLYLAFAPKLSHLGPFQDSVGIIESTRLVVFASMGWALSLIAGLMLRRRFPWLLFALLWFLLGHILESTTLLLELYFDHRNYIPMIGLTLALAVLIHSASGRLRRPIFVLSYLYVGILAFTLFTFTFLWGQPQKAAEFWLDTRPSSARAAVHFANLTTDLTSENKENGSTETSSTQRIAHALLVLDKMRHLCPNCLELDIQRLAYSCLVRDEEERLVRYHELASALKSESYNVNITMVDGFSLIGALLARGTCEPLTYQMLDQAIDKLMQHGKWIPDNLRIRLLYQRATLSYAQGDLRKAEDWILKAEDVDILALPVIDFQLEFYRQGKRYSDAIKSIDRRLDWIKDRRPKQDDSELIRQLVQQRSLIEEERKQSE